MTYGDLGKDLDPELFEYEPKEVDEQELMVVLAMTDTDPADIVDLEFREKYKAYLSTGVPPAD